MLNAMQNNRQGGEAVMTNASHQYLERLAEVSRQLGKDECLPDASRRLFSKAFDLADNCECAYTADQRVAESFTALCAACQAAGLHQCRRSGLLSCPLVWNYSS